jgi:hypothetical protein
MEEVRWETPHPTMKYKLFFLVLLAFLDFPNPATVAETFPH